MLPIDNYHPLLYLTLRLIEYSKYYCSTSVNVSKLDFKNCNIAGLSGYLNSIDWKSIFDLGDIDHATKTFYKYLYTAFDMHVPVKSFTPSNYPKWFTSELKLLIKQKKIGTLDLQE